MTGTGRTAELQALCGRIDEAIRPYRGRVEYGNLRMTISEWDHGGGEPVTNLALVYETPGGSTDQINISHYHHSKLFGIVDEHAGEVMTDSLDAVMESVRARIAAIPEKRMETLRFEIRRVVDGGSGTAGVFVQINQMMQSGFKGGTMTHLEMKDAMTFAVHYMKSKGAK